MSDDRPELVILAADPALHWGVAIGTTYAGLLESMHLDIRRVCKRGLGRQVIETADRIVDFADRHVTGGVDHLVYEKATPSGRGTHEAQYGMLTAVLMAAERLGASPSPEVIHPATLKKWATGNGHADKSEMVAAANEKQQRKHIVDDNEADAVCLFYWAMEKHIARQLHSLARS